MILGAGDPLFNNGVDGEVVLIVIGKTIVVFALLLVLVLLYIWFLRKVIADMQNRIGPERAGPFGVLQSLADGIKLFFKEQSVPDQADSFVFKLAPYLSAIPAFIAFSIVPIGGEVSIFGHQTYLQLADPEIGVLRAPRDVGHRALRRDARGLVERLEVPAARLGARVRAAHLLRGRVQPRHRRRAALVRARSRPAASSNLQAWDELGLVRHPVVLGRRRSSRSSSS